MIKVTDYDVLTHRALNGMVDKVRLRIKADTGWEAFEQPFYRPIPEQEGKGIYCQAMVKKEDTTPSPTQ